MDSVEEENVTKDNQNENADGTLGPNRIPLKSVAELAAVIKASTLPRRTLKEINLDVDHKDQRKEVVIMRALGAVGLTVEFTPGNQTAVDCIINGVSTQAKTYNIEKRAANASHKVNGKINQAYSASDGVQQLLEGKIIKSDAKYFLLYALQLLDALLYNGIFTRSEPYRGVGLDPVTATKWQLGGHTDITAEGRLLAAFLATVRISTLGGSGIVGKGLKSPVEQITTAISAAVIWTIPGLLPLPGLCFLARSRFTMWLELFGSGWIMAQVGNLHIHIPMHYIH